MTEMVLNKADIVEVLKTLGDYGVDHFKLIKHNECGIGYCLSIEYSTNMNGRMVTVTVPVVDEKDW